ncbi:MAG: N-acetylmuramoyl-L-alanine amidase family protein [Clostridia bacterium]|nr:N-acetylmuramoyl-L-alanine amidase family protein [Clostridia bacterium]
MKRLLSVVLAFVLCITSLLAVDVQTNAAVVYLDEIKEGEVWTKSWSSNTMSKDVNLVVEDTAFYNISVTDHKLTGGFVIDIYDLTEDAFLCCFDTNNNSVEHYTSKEILFYAEHTYQLTCYYYELEGYNTLDASLSLSFGKGTNHAVTIPSGSISGSNLQLTANENTDAVWLKYKTDAAGDYTLHFDELYASISLYEGASFTKIGYYDSVYYSKKNDEWRVKDNLIFTLKANTEYYFELVPNHSSNTKLSMTKNDKEVIEVILNIPPKKFSCFADIDAYSFTYTITFTNRTDKTYTYYEDMEYDGYAAPTVEYAGEYTEVGYDTYLQAGVQPIDVTFQGETTTYYVEVQSLTAWASNYELKGAEDVCTVRFRPGNEDPYWCRIKVAESGLYALYRYTEDDFDTNFDYYSLDIIDSNNEAAYYDYDLYGWALLAGREYVLKLDYIYASGLEANEVDFWLQKEANLKNGWFKKGLNWVFYENGILATGWRYLSSTWYYFNEDGIMQTGWQQINNTWYYFASGGNMLTGWQYIGNNWYYLNSGGDMKTGWLQNGSTWYYLAEGGNMVTGWQLVGSTWYYFNAGGVMQTGWQYIGNNWYYFNPGGDMKTGWLQNGSIWYYFAEGGNMAKGWQLVGSTWYYFNAGGAMQTGWLNVGGVWYYLAEGGNMVTGWQLLGGNRYYFDASGVWIPQ